MEDIKSRQIPAFGHWDYSDDIPITQYFESAWQAGLVRGRFWEEEADLFKVPVEAAYGHAHHHHRKLKKVGGRERKQGKEEQPKQGGACIRHSPRRIRTPKPVDEDLYKIPPELLCQKPKRRRFLRSLISGCIGINCVR